MSRSFRSSSFSSSAESRRSSSCPKDAETPVSQQETKSHQDHREKSLAIFNVRDSMSGRVATMQARVYTPLSTVMRLLGLDVGDKRIGIAVSDETALIASPRETLERKGNKKDITHLLELARREEVSEILVGMPWKLDGSSGPQAEKVSRFVEALRGSTDIPITTWDERLSTVGAERAMIEADVSRAKRRGAVDRVAAALILQSYLDARRATQENVET
jgi:putative Holliday junction resolvase